MVSIHVNARVSARNRWLLWGLMAVGLAVILSLLPWGVARSEAEPSGFRSVRLWVYPEYDDPRLLIMLEGKIEGASPPATVRFLVPAGAEMYSAGSMDSQGKYSGGPPRRKPSDLPGWDEISYEVTSDTFRVEYYHDVIRGQPDKTIAYEFRTLYPITGLVVYVQEPLKSSDFTITPKEHFTGTLEGFKTHNFSYPAVGKDSILHFDISYTKSDPNPSLGSSGTATKGSASSFPVAAVAIGLGVAVAIGIVWAVRARPQPRKASKRKERAARKAGAAKGQPRFCTHCGARLEGPGRFCPHCGAER